MNCNTIHSQPNLEMDLSGTRHVSDWEEEMRDEIHHEKDDESDDEKDDEIQKKGRWAPPSANLSYS